MRDHANRLKAEIATAWNEDWTARRVDTLAELEDKIEGAERYLQTIEGWIEEDRRRL